jgi:hypothetical protein
MRTLLLALLPIASIGCGDFFGNRDPHKPGTALGTFHVVGTQVANACGEGALGATSTWEFDVDLARDGDVLFWNNGANIIQGAVSDDGVSFTIEGRVLVDMRTEAAPGPPCSVQRHDVARGTLGGAGDDVEGFKGTLFYDFSPTVGSHCDDLVPGELSVAPVFATLPCGMAYDLHATRRPAAPE